MNGKAAGGMGVLACLLLTTVGVLAPSTTLAAAGELLWAKQATSRWEAGGLSIAADDAGSALTTGWFVNDVMFDVGEPNVTSLSASDTSLFVTKYAPDGTLSWAKGVSGDDYSWNCGRGISMATAGDVLVTGEFMHLIRFGVGEPNETTFDGGNSANIFIARYAPDGTLVWAKSAGGSQVDRGNGIAVDATGNALVTGSFSGSATFGAGEPNETTLTGGGMFIAQYATDGTLRWARSAGGADGQGIAVDASGNALVTGYYAGSTTFGVGESNATTLTAVGGNDVFIAQYATDGTLRWAHSAGGSDEDRGHGIAVGAAGNALVTGYFAGSTTFGASEANPTTLSAVGGSDVFIAQYAPDGTLVWAKSAGGAYGDIGRGIAVGAEGTALITGYFEISATFGAGKGDETTLTAVDGSDIFIAQYAPDGTLVWAKSAGGADGDIGYGIAVDDDGEAHMTGRFQRTAIFGAGDPNETSLIATGRDGEEFFVAKYAGAGVPEPAGLGVWHPSDGRFRLDTNGNGRWDGAAGGDRLTGAFGTATDLPVTGDWNGDDYEEVGFWRPGDRRFRLDANANDRWDGPAGGDTLTAPFGAATDLPVSGDWDGDGRTEVGVWRPSLGLFLLDLNANGCWDEVAGGDRTSRFGAAGDRPVAGDWNGDGRSEVGGWRPATGQFLLDLNGNGRWDGSAGGDTLTGWFGFSGDRPAIGDWTGDGPDEVGVRRPDDRRFRLDANANDRWDGPSGGDRVTAAFGAATDVPVAGRW